MSNPLQTSGTYLVADIARLLRCSERTVFRLVACNQVPGRVKGLSRMLRFSKSAVDAWIAGQHGECV